MIRVARTFKRPNEGTDEAGMYVMGLGAIWGACLASDARFVLHAYFDRVVITGPPTMWEFVDSRRDRTPIRMPGHESERKYDDKQ